MSAKVPIMGGEGGNIINRTCTVPITALKFFGNLLLSGEGPNLVTYDCRQQRKISTLQVFEYERVHGIVTCPNQSGTTLVAVFGGKSCCILCHVEESQQWSKLVSNRFDDWIWTVQWLPVSHLALALGHNAICLWNWKENQIKRTVHCEDKCILYSAHFIGNTWSDLILAAGTVFNQVVLWAANVMCNGDGKSPVLHRLAGHTGVIFSIRYNPVTKELCSVSDDRSIIIWKVEFGLQPGANNWCKASFCQKHRLFGHSARVWDVRLLTCGQFVSVGEDSTCIVWDAHGKVAQKFKGHRGKSIWSVDVNSEETAVATGGGDCSIRMWKLHPASHPSSDKGEEPGTDHLSERVGSWKTSLIKPDSCEQFFPRTVRLYGVHHVAVMSDNGTLYSYDTLSSAWKTLLCDTRYNSYSVLEVSHGGTFIAVGSICGNLSIIDKDNHRVSHEIYSGKVFSILWLDSMGNRCDSGQQLLTTGPDGQMNLWNLSESSDGSLVLASEQNFTLPPGKQRWAAAGCVVMEEDLFICGDRGGSVHIYNLNSQSHLDPVQSFWKIHGKAGVTDVCYHNNYVYTSGRDGCYRQYSIDYSQLHLLNSKKVLKGFEWISRLTFDEGDFQVVGFHTNNFIVHSIDRNQTLMCFPCGGGHRAWDFCRINSSATFVHIKNREVVVSQCKVTDRQHCVLKESLHGRELTCVRYIHSTPSLDLCVTCSEDTFLNLVTFTGPEVKVVHRLHGHISSVRAVTVVASETKQDESSYILFSGGGRAQIKAWKVCVTSLSSNGAAASNADDVRYEQMGSHMLGYKGKKRSKPWKRHLYNVSPETRFMDLTAFHSSQLFPGFGDSYVVAAACSDGFVRLFLYDVSQKDFRIIGESNYHDHCVLCIKHLILESSSSKALESNATNQNRCFICSTATDGKIAFWDITEVLTCNLKFIAEENVSFNESGAAVTCDTMCKLEETNRNKSQSSTAFGDGNSDFWNPKLVIPCHQSGVNTLDVFHLKDQEYLVASGGDDNCLAVQSVTLNGTSSKCHHSVTMSTAHSTQITGVKILDACHIISTSIDQRLSVWKIDQELGQITMICCKFIDIADVSSMDVWTTKKDQRHEVAVAGVGIQTLEVLLS